MEVNVGGKVLKMNEYANLCARIGELYIAIDLAKEELGQLEPKAKAVLKEVKVMSEEKKNV